MPRRIWPVFASLFCLPVCAVGCGGNPGGTSESQDRKTALALPDAPPAGAAGKAGDGAKEEAITRKIIYNAAVEVVVKDVEQARVEVERIVKEVAGYIAKSDISGQVGSKRTATWTLKVPAEKFPQVVTALTALGQVTKNSSDSQDVTEEFVDLQARIKNLKVAEDTLNKFLKESANSHDSYLKTLEQIAKVRGDIKRAEGRMKYLATMAAMSTITFTAREELAYSPEVPAAAPTFGDSVEGTFAQSWKALRSLGQGVVLFVVALAPWTPLIAAGFFLARFALRRAVRFTESSTAAPQTMARAVRKARPAPADEVTIVEDPPKA